MAKLLTGRNKILLGLAFLGDVFEETRTLGGYIGYAYKTVYGFTPYKYRKQRYLESVSKMIKTGHIERIVKNNQPYLRLHSSGKKRLLRDFPILKFQKKKWDRLWTIVIFDIAEVSSFQRRLLRTKLIELGFSMYQRSVYISPFNWVEDLRDFIDHRKFKEVRIFRAKEVFINNPQEQASQIWPLEQLEEEYNKLLEKIEKTRAKKGKEKEKMIKKIKSAYLDVLISDPHLPKELLPVNWPAEKIRKIIAQL